MDKSITSRNNQALAEAMTDLDLKFIPEYKLGSKYVDFYFPETETVIEFHGPTHYFANSK